MIKSKHELSIVRQCKLLEIHRSGVYYRAQATLAVKFGTDA